MNEIHKHSKEINEIVERITLKSIEIESIKTDKLYSIPLNKVKPLEVDHNEIKDKLEKCIDRLHKKSGAILSDELKELTDSVKDYFEELISKCEDTPDNTELIKNLKLRIKQTILAVSRLEYKLVKFTIEESIYLLEEENIHVEGQIEKAQALIEHFNDFESSQSEKIIVAYDRLVKELREVNILCDSVLYRLTFYKK